jgi:hypothetical protein
VSEEMQLELEHTLKTMRELKEAKAEIERLRAALREIEQVALSYVHMKYAKLARAALAEEKSNDPS